MVRLSPASLQPPGRALPCRPALALGLGCLLFLALCLPGFAQEVNPTRPLVASGTSPLLQQDVAEARNQALQEALRAAVEQALGRLLPVERLVRFYPLLLEQVLARPMVYVQDYQIIHEENWSGLYRVTVQASLYFGTLKQDLRQLGLFLADSQRPRVVILVAERPEAEGEWLWWWRRPAAETAQLAFSQALARLISARGLVPLDPEVLLKKLPADSAYQKPLLTDTQAIALARELGAQVVILGRVSYRPASPGAPAAASGAVRALRSDGGQVLADLSASVQIGPASEEQAADHGFTALARQLTPKLVRRVLASFIAVAPTPKKITVRVLGPASYTELVLIKEFLQRAPGVKQVRRLELGPHLRSFDLVLSGNFDDLCGALSGHDFGPFTTSVESAEANLLTLRVIRQR